MVKSPYGLYLGKKTKELLAQGKYVFVKISPITFSSDKGCPLAS